MLRSPTISGIPPFRHQTLKLGDRLNLITGDNGVGKNFHLGPGHVQPSLHPFPDGGNRGLCAPIRHNVGLEMNHPACGRPQMFLEKQLPQDATFSALTLRGQWTDGTDNR